MFPESIHSVCPCVSELFFAFSWVSFGFSQCLRFWECLYAGRVRHVESAKALSCKGIWGRVLECSGCTMWASCATPPWNAALPQQMEASKTGLFELNPGLCKSLVNSLLEGGLLTYMTLFFCVWAILTKCWVLCKVFLRFGVFKALWPGCLYIFYRMHFPHPHSIWFEALCITFSFSITAIQF